NDRSPYTTELPLPARPNRRSERRRVLSPRCADPLRSGAEQEDDGSPGTRDAPGSHRRSGALESFGRAEPATRVQVAAPSGGSSQSPSPRQLPSSGAWPASPIP